MQDKRLNVFHGQHLKTDLATEEPLTIARLSLDKSQDAAFRMDADAHFLYVNDAACVHLGYSREELLTLSVPDVDPDYNHHVWREHIQYVNEIGFQRFESRHQRKDGVIVPVEITTTLIQALGEVYYFAVVRDISERKKSETALRIAATTFEMPDPILIADANAKIVRVNSALERVTGYAEKELLGKKPTMLIKRKQNKALLMRTWLNLLEESHWSGELLGLRKDGKTYPAQVNVTVVKDGIGEHVHYVITFTDISARKQAEEEIHKLAYYDALTQLPNRRFLRDKFQSALAFAKDSRQYGALIFLDMDNFKALNDTLGHDYGDLLLKEVATRLHRYVRETDTIARFGGDEFVVLLENVGIDYNEVTARVAKIAENIRFGLSQPYQLNHFVQHSAPSIGISLFLESNATFDEQIKQADIAMYQAKDNGRNNVIFYDPQLQQTLNKRVSMESELRHAIQNNQLELYYQIQVNVAMQAVGAEALIRWHHPERGMVPPSEFIPIAEKSSLICEIGDWVLDHACQQIALWQQNAHTCTLTLAINISAFQFKRSDFVDQVCNIVTKHQIDPARLKLELTETVALENIDLVIDKITQLQAMHIQFALDDFGTGYSSLSYLKRLPVNQLKIDQSFVRDITTDANDAVMVKTMIDLSKNFGFEVIAEGVESEEHLAMLKLQGCHLYQGYLFSKPLPIKAFEQLLLAMRPRNGVGY